jgi:hypothetical protein
MQTVFVFCSNLGGRANFIHMGSAKSLAPGDRKTPSSYAIELGRWDCLVE